MRSKARPSSPQHHKTFCTFNEVLRPQILIMPSSIIFALSHVRTENRIPMPPSRPACSDLWESKPFLKMRQTSSTEPLRSGGRRGFLVHVGENLSRQLERSEGGR